MAKEIQLPALGENVETGDVVSVLVKEGDTIEENQAVLELETDKATVEVPADSGGVVKKIHVGEGDTVEVGQVILTLSEEESTDQAAEEEPAELDSKPSEEATGAAEAEDEEKSEDQTEKEEKKETEPSRPAPDKEKTHPSRIIPASPAVRRFAREIGVDLNQVEGTGPKGRISIDDVKAHSKKGRQTAVSSTRPLAPLPDFSSFGEVGRERFTNIRRVTAQHLAQAWNVVARVTNHDRADITELEGLRQQYKGKVEAAGGKLTMTAIALKILASAIRVFPKFNASLDIENQEIVYKKYFNIGVAVDTEKGLLVPVIRDVDQKNIIDLSVELKEIAVRAREGKISPDELKGGCITITNLGGIGGTSFTPIVNYPEVAILGMSRASVEPVFIEEEFEPRLILPLSLSYDHRLIDGAEAARFLRWLAEAFENPFLLSLEG